MKIAVIGAGFVGLTTALGLAQKGHITVCVDVNPDRVTQLNNAQAPFHEPGVPEMLAAERASGRFSATTNLAAALESAEVSLICVGTPSTEKGIDLTYINQVATSIGEFLKTSSQFHVVTVKSTVVPGTVDTAVRTTLEQATGLKSGEGFGLAMNPEFLREGCAVEDFVNPDRIVIGADDAGSIEVLKRMYQGFSCPVITTSTRNAEMIKYASNSLLATLISYANEITSICEQVPGLTEEVVMNGVFEDKRFWCGSAENRLRPGMTSYLRGGIGFGGSCFPKDVKALLRYAQNLGYPAPLLKAVLDINDARSQTIVDRLSKELGGSLQGKRIAIAGLAFKPDTDDLRESPALRIIRDLNAQGADIIAHDPIVTAQALADATGLTIPVTSLSEAMNNASATIIATSWESFKQEDWSKLAGTMSTPVIFDGRQVIPTAQRGQGFTYLQTGQA